MATLNDIYQVRFCCMQNNQLGEFVTKWQVTAHAGTGATDAQIATAFDTAMAALIKNCMSPNATYRGVGVRKLFPTKTLETTTIASTGLGTGGGNSLPTQVAALLKIVTIVPGRAGRGRIYVPFLSNTMNTINGELNAGALTTLGFLSTALAVPVVAGGGGNTDTLKIGVFHRAANSITLATNVTPSGLLATQRRRGDYGRTNITPF